MREKISDSAVFQRDFIDYLKAGYPLLQVITYEEERSVRVISGYGAEAGRQVYLWSLSEGLLRLDAQGVGEPVEETDDPFLALAYIRDHCRGENALFILNDFHYIWEKMEILRHLKDIAKLLLDSLSSLILLTPDASVPNDLQKLVTVMDFPLPDDGELTALYQKIAEAYGDKAEVDRAPAFVEKLLQAMQGLTMLEAENVLAFSLVRDGKLGDVTLDRINDEKRHIIKKAGILEYFPSVQQLTDIGGIANLKKWLMRKQRLFSSEAMEFGIEAPKGVLVAGVPGCGKSLLAKAVSSQWQMPLLRFDVGALFNQFVGRSEENMRAAIRTAEAVAPCVLWIDEIEKGFSGTVSSGSTDGGTTSRVFSTFLTWMQEKQKPVFVFATANDVSALPPELLRKGRFDEVFFVDLPSVTERQEIFNIHLLKRRQRLSEAEVMQAAEASKGFTGADIEAVVKAALEDAFNEGSRQISLEAIIDQLNYTRPLSELMSDKVQIVRAWASDHAVPASLSSPDLAISTQIGFGM